MSDFCQDRDLLSIEPSVFVTAGFAGQELIAGLDGAISGTRFTSSGSDFVTAKVAAGMVLSISPAAGEGKSFEIVSVETATSLTISVLRADTDDQAIPPGNAASLKFHVRTFGPQIRGVSETLAEKLRQISEAAGVKAADFENSAQLRSSTAHGALASIFLARADNAAPSDANWIKAEYYRNHFRQLQLQLRLVVDSNADGSAELTRTLGNVRLHRS